MRDWAVRNIENTEEPRNFRYKEYPLSLGRPKGKVHPVLRSRPCWGLDQLTSPEVHKECRKFRNHIDGFVGL
jgi:hypothetical protein